MFSVVIPAYNAEKTVEECLKSVFSQTAFALVEEIIVVDDGSDDRTANLVEAFAHKQPMGQLIRLIRQKNLGAAYARNRAIRMAKAEWIALLDSDDIWLEKKLEIQSQTIVSTPNLVFLGAQYPLRILLKSYTGLKKLSPTELCLRNMPPPSTVVFKRESGLALGLYNPEMRYGEDLNFHQKFFQYDSFYVAAEELIRAGIHKDYQEQKGMSRNLSQMYKGRNTNIRELCAMGYLPENRMICLLVFSFLKHLRKLLLCTYKKYKYKDDEIIR